MALSRHVSILALAAFTAACTLEADSAGRLSLQYREATEEEFRWQGRVSPAATVEVKGVNGAVRAEAGSGDRVEIVALKSGRRSNPAEVRIEVIEHAGGVTVCAVYPSRDPDEPNRCEPGSGGRMNTRNNDVKVDFTVRVPPGVHFAGKTVNGEVAAEGLDGEVHVRTVNGSVRFSTSGYGEGSTVNGSIVGRLGRTDWSEPLEFKTVNGSITLDLAGDLNAELEAKTVNGSISTDFPITVTGTFSRRSLRGTVGTGGRRISLSSVNGSIHLRRSA
jgi:hypothetical protein